MVVIQTEERKSQSSLPTTRYLTYSGIHFVRQRVYCSHDCFRQRLEGNKRISRRHCHGALYDRSEINKTGAMKARPTEAQTPVESGIPRRCACIFLLRCYRGRAIRWREREREKRRRSAILPGGFSRGRDVTAHAHTLAKAALFPSQAVSLGHGPCQRRINSGPTAICTNAIAAFLYYCYYHQYN